MFVNIRQAHTARKTRGKTAAVTLVILGLFSSRPVLAGESIRVLLVPDLPSVTISGSPNLSLTDTDGNSIAGGFKSPIVIAAGSQSLLVQNEPTDQRELVVSSGNGAIHINGRAVGGILHIALYHDKLRLVNELDIEDYLKGVVPIEISSKWHPEALKVQAIISRTYALYQRQLNLGKEYDVQATTADQVYEGRDKEDPVTNHAIAETRGLVLTFEGQLILSAYHSTSAGPTENAAEVWGMDLPYLKGVSCPFDQNSPYYQWNKSIPMEAVQKAFSTAGYPIGTIASITPFRWTEAGRISQIRLIHSQGELIITAEDLRRILGYKELPSAHFRIEKMGREIQLQGNGYGHGVGLCQWGAKEMAEMGYKYDRILKYYYPGILVAPYASLTAAEPAP
ncbi:MAG TPA: SpoIID/LytB domain-containing protein [Nitrospiria bacterium]|nr:SpoIID/LytB domain-containing protein [Nitrospiria bacterium]